MSSHPHRHIQRLMLIRVAAVSAVLLMAATIHAQVASERPAAIPFERRLQNLVEQLTPSMIAIQVASAASGLAASPLGLTSNTPIIVRNIPAIVIDSGGYLICAASLLVDNDSMSLKRGQIHYAVRRIGIDYRSGMALLQTNAPNLTPAALADNTPAAGAVTLFLRATGHGAVEPRITVASGASRVDGYLEFNGPAATTSIGGAFFNMSGQLVGMALGALENGPGASRVFAVPSERIGPILSRLRCCGDRSAGYLGVQVIDTEIRGLDLALFNSRSPMAAGAFESEGIRFAAMADMNRQRPAEQVIQAALITQVEPGSPADRAGLAVSDVILSYNNLPAISAASLRDFVRGCRPDSIIHLSFLRGPNQQTTTVKICAAPLPGGVDAAFVTPVSAEGANGNSPDVNALRRMVQKMERRIRALEDRLDERKR